MTLSAKIELKQLYVLSSKDPNCGSNILLFYQHSRTLESMDQFTLQVLGAKQMLRWHFTSSNLKVTISHISVILMFSDLSIVFQEQLLHLLIFLSLFRHLYKYLCKFRSIPSLHPCTAM